MSKTSAFIGKSLFFMAAFAPLALASCTSATGPYPMPSGYANDMGPYKAPNGPEIVWKAGEIANPNHMPLRPKADKPVMSPDEEMVSKTVVVEDVEVVPVETVKAVPPAMGDSMAAPQPAPEKTAPEAAPAPETKMTAPAPVTAVATQDWSAATNELVSKLIKDFGKPTEKVYVMPGETAAQKAFVTSLSDAMAAQGIPVSDMKDSSPFTIGYKMIGSGSPTDTRKLVKIMLSDTGGKIIAEESGLYAVKGGAAAADMSRMAAPTQKVAPAMKPHKMVRDSSISYPPEMDDQARPAAKAQTDGVISYPPMMGDADSAAAASRESTAKPVPLSPAATDL